MFIFFLKKNCRGLITFKRYLESSHQIMFMCPLMISIRIHL